jgi:hypothetical protein
MRSRVRQFSETYILSKELRKIQNTFKRTIILTIKLVINIQSTNYLNQRILILLYVCNQSAYSRAWPWSSKCEGPLTHRHGFTSLKTRIPRKWCYDRRKGSDFVCRQWSISCLQVHLVSEHIWCDDYLVRSFYLKNLKTGETRTVTQFHFLSWPDSGVPLSTKALLEFRRWEQF